MNSNTLVQKLWNYCHTLRDDGVCYGDYLEQLTYLLFLKMAHEDSAATQPRRPRAAQFDWPSLRDKTGEPLEAHYLKLLHKLGKEPGMLGAIFRKAQNKIQDPAKLRAADRRLIDAENWLSLDADVKGDAYEGLLEKNAEDTKSGAGQYFTPRPLIQAIVECVQPDPAKTICDPACGTGGFLLAAHECLEPPQADHDQRRTSCATTPSTASRSSPGTRRLCPMNLFLHGIGATRRRRRWSSAPTR